MGEAQQQAWGACLAGGEPRPGLIQGAGFVKCVGVCSGGPLVLRAPPKGTCMSQVQGGWRRQGCSQGCLLG